VSGEIFDDHNFGSSCRLLIRQVIVETTVVTAQLASISPIRENLQVFVVRAEYLGYSATRSRPYALRLDHGIPSETSESPQASQPKPGIGSLCPATNGVANGLDGVNVRHLMLKDIEVEPENTVDTQEDSDLCDPDSGAVRPGYCAGVKVDSDAGPVDHTGCKWIFSVSGQVFPSATIRGHGEIWRLISGSGSRGYSLALRDDDTGELLPFQILSLAVVAIDSTSADTHACRIRCAQPCCA
jgi:hypothetical protein